MKKLVLTLVAVMAVALTGCAAPGSASPTIGLSYIPNVQFSPFYVAETDGAFTAAGVKPTLRHHGESEDLFSAMLAGQEQFVVAGGDELMQARDKGMDLVAVASYYRAYPVEVIVPANSSIKSLTDLKGRTIGLPGKYGESWFALLVALRSAGLTEADVKIQEIGYNQIQALSQGQVDAVIGFSNNDAVRFQQQGFATRSLAVADSVPLVGACLITTTTYADQHPDVVRAVVAGTMTGIKSVVADPNHAFTVSGQYVTGLDGDAAATKAPRAVLAATIKLWTTPDGSVSPTLDEAQWAKMADFMAQEGLTATRQDPTAAMTNSFN
jgi:NitT/TauT family transport system substrate-binding protein